MFDAAQAVARPRITTPAWLAGGLAGIVAMAVLAAALSLWASASISDAAQTIGRDAEPSVALALRMAATLADMDAAAVDDALTDDGAAIGTSRQFRAGTAQLARDLVAAARNITYGEAEAAPLRDLALMLQRYQEAVVEARYLGQGDRWFTARRVQWASRVNHDFATPAARALAAANADELEGRYDAYRATSLLQGGVAVASFGLLVAGLLAVQVFIARRMRRLLNPLLLAATLVAASGGLWFGDAVLSERNTLRVAKSDAYDSLHVLFDAKSAVNELRASMTLWLLDPLARDAAQARMAQAETALTGQPGALAHVQLARQQEAHGEPATAGAGMAHLGGLLGTELDNITFGVAERDAATRSVALLADAETAISLVQAEELRRSHATAVALWLSERPVAPAGIFAALQAALDSTIAVNQSQFDQSVTTALNTAAPMPFVTCGALALAALLASAGVWLRLREYR